MLVDILKRNLFKNRFLSFISLYINSLGNYFILSIILPYTPTTVTPSGTFFNTTVFAPIFTLSPIFIGPKHF